MNKIYLCFIAFSLSAKPLDVEVSARAAVVMNAETGEVLYEKNGHLPSFPASITKIGTALYVVDEKRAQLDQIAIASLEALKISPDPTNEEYPAYWGDKQGTRMWLVEGEKLSIDTLLHGLLRVSGNDAANVIAEALAPSIPAFVSELNQYLKKIGCENTCFQNPHGLHRSDHVTTAYDMCLIAKKGLAFPKFRELVSNSYYRAPKTNKRGSIELEQNGALLKPGKYFYPKAIGIKTGFHSHAMHTIVAIAEHEGRTLVATLLGCPDKGAKYRDAARLFEAAFAEKKLMKTLYHRAHLFRYAIEGAKTELTASLDKDVAISYFPAEEPKCRAFVKWDVGSLPIRQGQKVGVIEIHDGQGNVLQQGALLAKEDVYPTWKTRIKRLLTNVFSIN